MEKMDNVQERRGDLSREMANLRRIEKEMQDIKNSIT